MNLLTAQIITEANKYVGIREEPSNDGSEIRAWLKRVGVHFPAPWCAAFAWCMLDDACKVEGITNIIPPTASSHLLLQFAREKGCWTNEPGPGFIFGIDHGKANGMRIGHAGIVVEAHEAGHLLTLEGNTNSMGSREGNALMLKGSRRAKDMTLGYLDPGMMLR
jgi:hypothetical protein